MRVAELVMHARHAVAVSDPVLRTGGPEDLAVAQSIHDAYYVDSGRYRPVFSEYVATSIQAFRDAWDPDRDRVWLAHQDGRLVGYVAVCHRDGDERAQLRYLYVDPVVRGQGLGTGLVRRVVDFARDRGYAGVMLWTMEGLNAARRLYEAAGFRWTEDAEAPWHETLRQQRFDLDLAPP